MGFLIGGRVCLLSRISTVEDVVPGPSITARERGDLSPSRLQEHLRVTVKRLKRLGICRGDRVASVLPDGPDAATARLALAAFSDASFTPLDPGASLVEYQSLLLEIDPKLLLMHPGDHPARQAASSLGISVANVLRHFEAGVFTLEAAIPLDQADAPPVSQTRDRGVPLVLIAPGLAYRRLAHRLDSHYPVVGITPPSLEHLPPPHSIEHVAAECVRMLRRCRPEGPYALAGWRAEGLVALEMARLLEEDGASIAFVAMLDAADLFRPRVVSKATRILSALGFVREKYTPPRDFMAQALRQYRPQPWYGKILHIRQGGQSGPFQWRHIAPHGLVSYEASGEMQNVAEILAAELSQVPTGAAPRLET